MSEKQNKPQQFWIAKGTNKFTEGHTDIDTQSTHNEFYDLISSKNNMTPSVHVVEYSAYAKAVSTLRKISIQNCQECAEDAYNTLKELGEL